MSRDDLADHLYAAAKIADVLPRGDLQALLRRAALRVRNDAHPTGTVNLDVDLAEIFDEISAVEGPLNTRNDLINAALRTWATDQGYLGLPDAEEDGDTAGALDPARRPSGFRTP